jgi:hypothetical protein
MQQHWPHSSCYNRRAFFGLALTPWLVSAVRAEDPAAMPPQPEGQRRRWRKAGIKNNTGQKAVTGSPASDCWL